MTSDDRITITSATYAPMEADEEPGMPSFNVEGTADGRPFKGQIHVEVDGRDIDWTGDEFLFQACDHEALCLIATAIADTPAWKEAAAEHQF